MKNEILKEILDELSINRNNQKQKVESVYQQALSFDDFKILDNQQRALVLEIAKKQFENEDTTSAQQQMNEIKKQKDLVLKSHGINPSNLQEKYFCTKCEDLGFANGQLCSCVLNKYSQYVLNMSNIKLNNYPYLKEYNFSVFSQKSKENMQKTIYLLQKYINSYEARTKTNINFIGQSGAGKTYLALTLMREIQNLNYVVTFSSAFNLNADFLKIHTAPVERKNQLLSNILESDFLVIDDLGTEPYYNNVTSEYLFLLINERQLRNLPTVITTNMAPDEILNKYGERVFSRIFNKQKALTIKFDNPDMRLQNN